MTVGLRYAQVDRQVCAASKTNRVIKCDMAAEVGFGQTVNAQLPAKAATVEHDGAVSERSKFHYPRDDVGLDAERAAVYFVEPKVNARQIACRNRSPRKCGRGCRLSHHPLRIEKIDRRKSSNAIARDCQLAFPQRLASAAPIFGALPHHAHAPPAIGRAVRTKRLSDYGSVQNIDPLYRCGSNHLRCNTHRRAPG